MRRARVKVSGNVQGVFFRTACADAARAVGVSGSVRNVPGGAVEAVFEGEDRGVEAMLRWCRVGPPLARVEHVGWVDETPTGETGFRIEH
ncbi:MAG TPA: acylphosphatase [Actinomycetota bacterium]|jgi:acylphosphatase|nr:acylphosphatase [Actinomycetota bacterium]